MALDTRSKKITFLIRYFWIYEISKKISRVQYFLNYQEKQIKEEKEKSQKSLQNQAESFKKSIEELKDAKKVVEDKMNQIVQEKAKLQSELENASEFQKKRMDTMHTKASIFDRKFCKLY